MRLPHGRSEGMGAALSERRGGWLSQGSGLEPHRRATLGLHLRLSRRVAAASQVAACVVALSGTTASAAVRKPRTTTPPTIAGLVAQTTTCGSGIAYEPANGGPMTVADLQALGISAIDPNSPPMQQGTRWVVPQCSAIPNGEQPGGPGVTSPTTVSPTPAVTPDNSGTATPVYSPNWGGFVSNTGDTYSSAESEWSMPSSFPTPPGNTYESSWPGIGSGSSKSAALLQAGTAVDVSSSGSVTMYPWWEFYPMNTEQRVGGLTIEPGSTEWAEVDHTGSGQGYIQICSLYDEDWNCVTPFSVSWPTGSGNYTLDTSQYECIAERPEQSDGTWQRLTDISGMSYTGCNGITGGNWVAMGDASRTYWYITKTQTSSQCFSSPFALETGDISDANFPMDWLGYAFPISASAC